MPDYELDLISKGTNFPDEAILLAVGEEEDEAPHDWQMFFDGSKKKIRRDLKLTVLTQLQVHREQLPPIRRCIDASDVILQLALGSREQKE